MPYGRKGILNGKKIDALSILKDQLKKYWLPIRHFLERLFSSSIFELAVMLKDVSREIKLK